MNMGRWNRITPIAATSIPRSMEFWLSSLKRTGVRWALLASVPSVANLVIASPGLFLVATTAELCSFRQVTKFI